MRKRFLIVLVLGCHLLSSCTPKFFLQVDSDTAVELDRSRGVYTIYWKWKATHDSRVRADSVQVDSTAVDIPVY